MAYMEGGILSEAVASISAQEAQDLYGPETDVWTPESVQFDDSPQATQGGPGMGMVEPSGPGMGPEPEPASGDEVPAQMRDDLRYMMANRAKKRQEASERFQQKAAEMNKGLSMPMGLGGYGEFGTGGTK